jgi:hypothetical protein
MTADHSSYEDIAAPRRGSQEYQEGYAEARRAFLIGRAVRERRLALGLSQVELATRADMTQPRSHGWKRAASSPRFRCWNESAQPSTPTSSWNSHPTQPELPATVVVKHAFESAEWRALPERIIMRPFA